MEDRVYYRSDEAFKKIVSAGIDDGKIIEDKRVEERKLIRKFNNLRKRENSLLDIRQKLNISWHKVKRLEAYRLLNLGRKRKDIAKELKVNLSTISKWRVLQKKLDDEQTPYNKEKKQHFNFESSSGGSSSGGKKKENQGRSKSRIDYHFSRKTLDFVQGEDEQTHD